MSSASSPDLILSRCLDADSEIARSWVLAGSEYLVELAANSLMAANSVAPRD